MAGTENSPAQSNPVGILALIFEVASESSEVQERAEVPQPLEDISALTIGMWPMAALQNNPTTADKQWSEWTHLSCRIACVHSGHRRMVMP
jgi:hypothetical protein